MNRRTAAGLITSAVLALTLLTAGCGGLPDNAPAKVGDVLIDNARFLSQVESFASQYGVDQASDPESYASLAADVLDSMITTELAAQKALELGIPITDAEVQERIDAIVNDYYDGDKSALVDDLATESMTLDDLGKQVRDFLLVGKVRDEVTKDVTTPSEDEIAAYYDENKSNYLTAETIDARHILVATNDGFERGASSDTAVTSDTADTSTTSTTEYSELAWARALATAAQVRAALLDGGSWSRLAAKYSDDQQTKDSGGDLGTVSQGDLIEAFGEDFDNALFSLQLDQISEPIMTANGYHIIQVTKANEPRQQTLEEARETISTLLLGNAQEKLWRTFIDQAKAGTKIVYREDLRPTTTTTVSLPANALTTSTTVKP